MDAETLKIILDLKEENVLLKRAILDATFMLYEKKTEIAPLSKLFEVRVLLSKISKLLSPVIDGEPSPPIMSDENFETLSGFIKRKLQPSLVGCCLSTEQVEVIKSIYADQNRELDDYFKHCVEARLFKKSV